MQPSTSAVQNLASNILDEKDLEEEDARFLLKALGWLFFNLGFLRDFGVSPRDSGI